MAISVLLADDHEVVRRGLRLFLDLQPDLEVVGEAEEGADAVAQAAALRPDVVVMDVVMPGLDGIGATRALKERLPRTGVLVLSSFSDADRVLPALQAGADGYLTKDSSPEAVADAIRAVSRSEPVLSPAATRRVLEQLERRRQRPHGTVTVLFTDMAGSTELLESLGEEQARRLFREHDELVRAAVAECGGVEVERDGDAFMLAFASARSAVRCAAAIQRSLERAGPEMRLRIGLNTGDVISEEDGYFGRAIFVASRVAGTATGGEVLVTELTRTLAGDDGFRFRDRGAHRLKGLKGEHRLFALEWDEA